MRRLGQHGPLTIQKALYPEGRECCHAIILHPPAGMVEQDHLTLKLAVGNRAAALVTTPGATKWYTARGEARLRLTASVGDGATLEYLPQENIVFDGAQAAVQSDVDLVASARFVLLDVTALGRAAVGETLTCGKWRQRTTVRRDGEIIWWENMGLCGSDSRLVSPAALGGATAFGTLLLAASTLEKSHLDAARAVSRQRCRAGVTLLPGILVARALGDGTEVVRNHLIDIWHTLRPTLIGRAAQTPRIWRT